MSSGRRYRVVRCGRCETIYPYRRRRCTSCGADERVFALASLEEVERARLRQGVARKEIRVPRGVAEPPLRTPFWRQLVDWHRAWIPHLIGKLQRR